jgi:hypothetical protein
MRYSSPVQQIQTELKRTNEPKEAECSRYSSFEEQNGGALITGPEFVGMRINFPPVSHCLTTYYEKLGKY